MPPRRPAAADALTYALIYGRVSSEDQRREGVSLDVQLAECRRYAVSHGWILANELIDVLSGTRDDRPAYRALLQECRDRRAQGQAVAVVVLRLDRLGRRLIERVRSRAELQQLGVPVHSVREGGEVSDLVANILASVAQEEVRQLGERVSDARQHLTRGGWWSGGRPPWGYQLRPATAGERAAGAPQNVLELNPATAPFAREALTRFLRGASVHEVTRWMATLPAAARQDRQLGYARLRDWLAAEAPRGRCGGQPAQWPALIDATEAAAVDARIAGWQGGRRQPSGRYLLTGLLRCPRCGTPMVGARGTGGRATRYRCNQWRRNVTPRACCTFGGPVARIDAAVLAAVGRRLAPLQATARRPARELARRWPALAQTAPTPLALAQQQALERTRAQASRRLRDAATLFVDGALDRAGYEAVRAEQEAILEAATASLARLPTPPALVLPDLAAVQALARAWPVLVAQNEPSAVRELLIELIETIRPDRRGRGQWGVAITWTPLGHALGALSDVGA